MTSNHSDFSGKTVVITGGASGIGKAAAEAFADQGASIVIADINEEQGLAVERQLRDKGAQAYFHAMDVRSESDHDELMDLAVDKCGGLDILLAAAATGTTDKPMAEIDPEQLNLVNLSVEEWQRLLDVNLNGVMLADRAAARKMVAAKTPGAIINISSGVGVHPFPGSTHYASSKAAVIMLTKALALELVAHGIRTNCICPGYVDTPLVRNTFTTDEEIAMAAAIAPMARMGCPEEIADTILFLASDKSSFYTGQVFHPNGGFFVG